MGQLGHEYCVHNGFNRSHAGKYVYSLATFISWILIYFLLSSWWIVSLLECHHLVLSLLYYFYFYFYLINGYGKQVYFSRF